MISKNSARTVIIVMAITLVGKVMGILRDRMQAVYFGTYSVEGIAFTQASLLPRVFLDIMFASVLSASFIPVFNRYLETKGKEAALELAASFIKIVLLVTVVVTALAMIFAGPIYSFWGTGESELGVRLLRMMLPIIVITSLAFSFTGILQSLGQFYIPAAMSIASNGVILLYYFIFIDRFGVYGLVIAFLAGWSMQVLIQVPFLVRTVRSAYSTGQRIRPVDGLGEIWRLSLPVMVASWLGPVNLLVNTRAVVGLEHGVVAINLAYTLYTVITGLLVLSLANVLFPSLSKMAALEDWAGYALSLRTSIRALLFLLLPMTFGLMAVARPLVAFVFQGGRFGEASVDTTASALFFFSVGIVGFGLQVVLSRACFALQDGRGPLVTGVAAMVINFVLSFALAPHFGVAGPALASALAVSGAALGLFVRLRRNMKVGILDSKMAVDGAKMLVLAIIMFAAVSALPENLLLRASVGALVYMAGALIFRLPEAKIGLGWIEGINSIRKRGLK